MLPAHHVLCNRRLPAHFLPVADSVIEISAYDIPGQEKNKKILKIASKQFRIRHKSILNHSGITKAGKMIAEHLVWILERKSASGCSVASYIIISDTGIKYTLILIITRLVYICHYWFSSAGQHSPHDGYVETYQQAERLQLYNSPKEEICHVPVLMDYSLHKPFSPEQL